MVNWQDFEFWGHLRTPLIVYGVFVQISQMFMTKYYCPDYTADDLY